MSRSRPPYPAEYRAELVRLVREEGRTPAELAKEFEPSARSITNWVAQAEIDAGRREGLTTDEKAELKRLRSENRVLRMEKDILEKAAAFFAAKNTPTR
jgi:transposase